MSCISEPPTPPPVIIQRPADLAAESIFNSYVTDPTTGQSRPVIVGIVRNVGESSSVGNRTVTFIATTIVNSAPITEQLASSVSPGDNNTPNDTFILNSSAVQRYY